MVLLSLIATGLWEEDWGSEEEGAADSGLGSAWEQMSQADGVQSLSMYPRNMESKGGIQS